MTFREKLNNDLDGISPSDELLSKVSQMMAEEAKKPKQPIYLNVAKWGTMAAAVCLIAVGAVTFLGNGKDAVSTDTSVADAAGYAATDGAVYDNSANDSDKAAYALDIAADEACEEAEIAADESDDSVGIAEAYVLENEEAAASAVTITLSAEAYLEGSELFLSDYEIVEILKLAENYVGENEYAMLDLLMSDTEIEKFRDNGLYIRVTTADGSKAMVLADDSASYIFYKWDFYSLDSDTKAAFLKYAE